MGTIQTGQLRAPTMREVTSALKHCKRKRHPKRLTSVGKRGGGGNMPSWKYGCYYESAKAEIWESFVNSGTFRFSQVRNTLLRWKRRSNAKSNFLELSHFELRAWVQFNKGLFYMLKDVFLCKQRTCKYMQIDISLYPHLKCKSTSKSTMTKKKKLNDVFL